MNSHITGLGDDWLDPSKERDNENLAEHFLKGAALVAYEQLLKNKDDEASFKAFCKARRELIQDAFVRWLRELQKAYRDRVKGIGAIEPAKRRQKPNKPAQGRPPSLTPKQLCGLAEEHGVVDLYDQAMGLRKLFANVDTTQSNVALYGHFGANRSRQVVVGIWPKASSRQDGLALTMNVPKVCELFGVDETALRELIGSEHPTRKVLNVPIFFFRDAKRLAALTEFLSRAKRDKEGRGAVN